MEICDNGHDPIVHENPYYCPLCQLTKHNNIVHDFIESKGLEKELVKFQQERETKEQKDNANRKSST